MELRQTSPSASDVESLSRECVAHYQDLLQDVRDIDEALQRLGLRARALQRKLDKLDHLRQYGSYQLVHDQP